ncbi:Vacuolar protein sorting-associated protein 13 [Phytophthora cactorum]|nr:Vacuolar protein sorting-associated protein 13 [Phytophthora cactorum]
MEEQSVLSSVDAEANERTFSRKLSGWVASSFLDNLPGASPETEKDLDDSTTSDVNDGVEVELPASMQLRLHVQAIPTLLEHVCLLDLAENLRCISSRSAPQRDHISWKYSPRTEEDEMWINRDDTREYDGGIAVGHVPALSEILIMLDDVPAVFSCAAQFYGADSIQEAWHPGYSSRYSVRLKSPRIRFLYSFVDDMRNYWMKGVLLETVLSILSQEQADMLWEGDFQLADIQGGPTQAQRNEEKEENGDEAPSGEFLGSDVVSMFPLVDIRLEDTLSGMENRIVAKVLLNSSLKQLQLDMKALRIVSVILVDRNDVDKRLEGGGFITQSLLGLTNYSLSVDFRSHADLKLTLIFNPVRLVCNQEQYAFVLRVPFQNYRERSRYHFSQGTDAPTKPGARVSSRRFSLSRSLDGASSSGRIVEDGDEFRSVSSRAIVGLFGSELSLRRTDSEMSAYSPMSSTVTSHGAHSEKSSKEKTPPVVGTEGRMDLVIDIAGFKVIPSNIHYDLIQFLTIPPGLSGDAEGSESSRGETEEDGDHDPGNTMTVPPVYRRISLELNLGPSALLLVENPHKLKSRALMLSWESSVILNYLQQANEDECPNIEDKVKESPAHSRNQLQFCVAFENIHATSRLSEESVWAAEQSATAASADCLKPIDMETVLQMDLRSRFLRFRTTFNRVMELRFGYLDFCTTLAALEHILRRPTISVQPTATGQKRRSMSGSSISSLSGGGADSETSSWSGRRRSPRSGLALSTSKKAERQRTAALYGSSLIYLVSASFRGRLETRPVVGFYNSTWRKRYLVLPYTAQQRQLVESVAFRILPATGSRREIGDEIYYGDRIILEAVVDNNNDDDEKTAREKSLSREESAGTPTADAAKTAQSTLIRKYDQLGANGYLGPEGSAGAFETTIWKHGSTMFNSDKSVIYDRELIVFEELTIYRSFSKGKKFGAAGATGQQMDFNSARSGPQAEGAHTVDTTGARGGGYLMFNGVDIRGRLEDKFTALTSLRFGIQAYNSQLAVWEPVLEDFEVNMAYHGKGGVLCDYCMSERQSVSPTGAALRCDGMPLCLFRSSRTEVFTNAAAHSWESKNFIYRELLEQPDVQDGAKLANTFMIVVKDDFNINVSRNVINVLVHFFALVTKVTAADEALSSRLGPFIYVDNQSGIPFVVATHPSSSSGAPPTAGGTPSSSRRPTSSIEMPTEVPGADTNDDIMKTGTAMFNSNAWSRRRLTTMLNDISSSDTKWIRVESGERVATEIVAHEAPAGTRHTRPATSRKDPADEFLQCPHPSDLQRPTEETIEPGGKAAHYIPIQYLESGTIAFRPLLSNGKVQHSEPLLIASLLRSNDNKVRGRSNRRQNVGSLELRKALTFYWDVHPSSGGEDVPDFTFGVSLPPFQVILTALRKSERHETTITLRPPIVLENLVPYELSYRTVCMKSEAEVVWVAKNAASFSGVNGKVSSGSSACVAELDVLERDMESGEIVQTPTVVGLSLALPQIQLGRFSRWSRDTFIYGCQSFCERIELNMRDDSELEAPTPANKLTICVEITQLEKLRSRALNTLCPVVCRVFTEYWLIDRTSLSLAFYTADDYLIPSNHPGRLYDDKGDAENESSSVSLSVFSCESKQVVSKMKIGIKGGKGEREVQSEPFDISAVGVRGQILVPTNRSRDARSLLSTIAEFGAPSDGLKTSFKQYEFGVMIEQGPEKFSRSRVVTLVPRYYFINTSNRFEIRIRQERSADPSAVIVLRPQETKIFHWSDSRLPSRVQICFVLPDNRQNERDTVSYANSSQWSAPFELSSVGNFVLRVKTYARGGNSAECSVELHDPSFLVYLEEGEQSVQSSPLSSYAYEEDDREHTLTVKHKENEGFVPFKIKNECSNLALVVWQKTLVKDDKGNVTIGFEGGEPVLPFHTIDYVPFRFSAFPTVFVQVQKVAGLGIGALRKEHPLHGNRSNTLNSKTPADRKDKEAPVTALTRAATVGQTQVVASFEVQLKKLQRLPTIDVSEGVVKKRLWAEVLLDETTKTLLVTDMLPGFSGEHKRRRRATLLRRRTREEKACAFRGRRCGSEERMKRNSGTDEDETAEADQQGTEAGSSPPSIEEEKEVEALVLCVRLVDATYLEDVFLQAGRSDLTSCQPFITFSLKTDGEEARTKLTPQSTTMFPRWLPASNSRAALSALMLSDGGEESSSHEFGAGAEIIVEYEKQTRSCSAPRSGANHELQVVEFLAPVAWLEKVEAGLVQ